MGLGIREGIVRLAEAVLPLPDGNAVADELTGNLEKGTDQHNRLLSEMPLNIADALPSPYRPQTVAAARAARGIEVGEKHD